MSHLSPPINPIECASNEALLGELARRQLLAPLHGAVGALYDHLERTGALDGESALTSYLAYRVRREEASVTGSQSRATDVAYWDGRIRALSQSQASAAA